VQPASGTAESAYDTDILSGHFERALQALPRRASRKLTCCANGKVWACKRGPTSWDARRAAWKRTCHGRCTP